MNRPTRINKFLARCGISSRRGAEKIIAAGRVTLNGLTVEIGALVNERDDVVMVDGSVVTPVRERLYALLNKPRQVMTTLHDPFRRRTVAHLIKNIPERVFPVGRLDFSTEGVLLLTNDGELAYRLTHPSYQIPKLYQAVVEGQFTSDKSNQLANGIRLADGAIGKARVEYIVQGSKSSTIKLTLLEGRKREVLQLCKAVGHPVKRLTRLKFAGLTADGVKRGKWRYLKPNELRRLKQLVGLTD